MVQRAWTRGANKENLKVENEGPFCQASTPPSPNLNSKQLEGGENAAKRRFDSLRLFDSVRTTSNRLPSHRQLPNRNEEADETLDFSENFIRIDGSDHAGCVWQSNGFLMNPSKDIFEEWLQATIVGGSRQRQFSSRTIHHPINSWYLEFSLIRVRLTYP